MSLVETLRLALRLVPAERVESPLRWQGPSVGRLRHTFSAGGLRHWLRLQTNNTFIVGRIGV